MDKDIKMILTDRDRELMRWINSMGFVTIDCIVEKMNIHIANVYRRLRKLVANEYIIHERIHQNRLGTYYLSAKGTSCSDSNLPPLRRISWGTYKHDLLVARLGLALQKQFGGEYISERELKYQKTKGGKINNPGHVADGQLNFDSKSVLIEVELRQKGSQRLKKIMTEHMKNFDIDEVWYFCGSKDVFSQIKEYKKTCRFLKVFDLYDCLPTSKRRAQHA